MEEVFIDRESEKKYIMSLVLSGSKIWILGLRGYGKTSLVRNVLEDLRKRHLRGLLIDCLRIYSGEDLLLAFLKEVEGISIEDVGNISKEIRLLTRKIGAKDALEELFNYAMEIGLKVIVFDEISTLIQRFGLLKPYRGFGGIKAVGEHLKTLLNNVSFSVIFIDTSINALFELFKDYTAPLFKEFTAEIKISPLDLDFSLQLVDILLSRKGFIIDDEVKMAIAEYSGGVPQYIKMISDLIYKPFSRKEFDEIFLKSLREGFLNDYLRALFEKFSPAEQEVLYILSRGPKRFSEINSLAVNAAATLEMLQKKLIVNRIDKGKKLVYYEISDRLFATWLALQEFPRLKKISGERARIYYLGLEALVRELFFTLKDSVMIIDELGDEIVIKPSKEVYRYEGALGEIDLVAVTTEGETYIGEVYGGFKCPKRKVDELLKNIHIMEKLGKRSIIGLLISYHEIPSETLEYIRYLKDSGVRIYALTKKQLRRLSKESLVKI